MGGGFFTGVLIGFALKKVVKIAETVVVGLFFAAIVYLQYQQILNINWNKIQAEHHKILYQCLQMQQPKSQDLADGTNHTEPLAFTNLGIPLTGSMSMGFAIGFMKG